jgi:hypothetical protein
MKIKLCALCLIAIAGIAMGESHIRVSVRDLGDSEGMKKGIEYIVEDYSAPLRKIRDGLRTAVAGDHRDLEIIIPPTLRALDAVLEQRDGSKAQDILPFVDWLNDNQGHPIAGILGGTAAQGTLNYLVDGIFSARMLGAADAVGEQEMEAMIRFYAGNPAQTSEGSWQTTNTMLFVFGDRVLNTLVTKVPDRVDAFYKAVQDARKSAQSGPGPDEEVIPDAERPTAEQLRAYEASFGKLEELAIRGALPKSDPKSQTTPTQASVSPPTVPAVPTAPKKAPSTAAAPSTPSEEPTSSTPWSVIIVLIVAAIGLLWLLVKKRK